MLVIEVQLLHGTLRAGSPDDLALSGGEDVGEWPPSPARLFAALVAADGSRDRMHVTDGRELALLERAAPPVILADSKADVLTSQQLGRFVVVNQPSKGAAQEYVGRTNTLVRPAPRMSPRNPQVLFIWESLDPTEEELVGLRARAARVGYLGCADSPVRVRVHRHLLTGASSARRWEPDGTSSLSLPVPFEGLLEALDRMYDDFMAGAIPRRSWYPTRRHGYRPPGPGPRDQAQQRAALWLRFDGSTTGRHALRVAEVLRAATLSAYEKHVAGGRDGVPAVLHGHGFEGRGYDHAYWLVLPDVGHAHATGRLHGAAVVLPSAADTAMVEALRRALWHVRLLRLPGGRALPVRPFQGEPRPWASHPRRWLGPARRWVSALPVVHERWSKRDPTLDEVAEWCRNAGVTAKLRAARVSRTALLAGAVSLMPHEATREGSRLRPYSHVELEFETEVRGPLALGRLRHFGLGLMTPAVHGREGRASR